MLLGIDLSFLDINNPKNYATYAIYAFIGLYTNIYFNVRNEHRGVKWSDLGALLGQLPFVLAAALYIDNSPWYSLIIGFAPERITEFIKNGGVAQVLTFVSNIVSSTGKDNSKDAGPKS